MLELSLRPRIHLDIKVHSFVQLLESKYLFVCPLGTTMYKHEARMVRSAFLWSLEMEISAHQELDNSLPAYRNSCEAGACSI